VAKLSGWQAARPATTYAVHDMTTSKKHRKGRVFSQGYIAGGKEKKQKNAGGAAEVLERRFKNRCVVTMIDWIRRASPSPCAPPLFWSLFTLYAKIYSYRLLCPGYSILFFNLAGSLSLEAALPCASFFISV